MMKAPERFQNKHNRLPKETNRQADVIYLDNAATTFPKPPSVYEAVFRCMKEYGGNPGRSGHRLSMAAAEAIYRCRAELASLFGSAIPTNVVFTSNATASLNVGIKSLMGTLGGKQHILLSDIEHNSVLRPIAACGCPYSLYSVGRTEEETMRNLKRVLRPDTGMIVANHLSNVCGLGNPARAIGRLCREKDIRFLLDVSQSAGSHRIDLRDIGADCLCGPGHKGLYGPQGCGFLLFADKYAEEETSSRLATVFEGGNGVDSKERKMPSLLPERLEAGTLSTPAIAGLCEGIRFVKSVGEEEIGRRTAALRARLISNLKGIKGVILYGEDTPSCGCLLFNTPFDPSEAAEWLDREGFALRSGFHCAPTVMEKLGCGDRGALRASFSYFNTAREIDLLSEAVERIIRKGTA